MERLAAWREEHGETEVRGNAYGVEELGKVGAVERG